MLSWLLGRMRCLSGKHERSQKHAVRLDGDEQYTSKCAYCGVPMRRLAKRRWIVDRHA